MPRPDTLARSPSSSYADIPIGPQRAPRGTNRTCKTWAAEAGNSFNSSGALKITW